MTFKSKTKRQYEKDNPDSKTDLLNIKQCIICNKPVEIFNEYRNYKIKIIVLNCGHIEYLQFSYLSKNTYNLPEPIFKSIPKNNITESDLNEFYDDLDNDTKHIKEFSSKKVLDYILPETINYLLKSNDRTLNGLDKFIKI